MTTKHPFDGHRLSDMQSGGGFAIFDEDTRDNADHLVVVLGKHRESEVIDESNFAHGVEAFGIDAKTDQNEAGTAFIQRYGHPLVGWVDYLVIDDRHEDVSKIALGILERMDAYPILDEDDFSEREQEELDEYVRNETHYMTSDMPDDVTDKERSTVAGHALYRHHKTGGNVQDFDTEGNFGYGVARVMLNRGITDDDTIIAAMSYSDRIGFGYADQTVDDVLDEARKDHENKENA